MDNPKVKWAVGLVAVLALAAATYLGVKLPAQPEYVEPPAGASTQLYDVNVQGTFTIDGTTHAASDPITITGVLTDVIILFEQQ